MVVISIDTQRAFVIWVPICPLGIVALGIVALLFYSNDVIAP